MTTSSCIPLLFPDLAIVETEVTGKELFISVQSPIPRQLAQNRRGVDAYSQQLSAAGTGYTNRPVHGLAATQSATLSL